MKTKQLGEIWFNLSWWKHFILFFIFAFVMTQVFRLLEPEFPMKMCLILSLAMGLIFTTLVSLGKTSQEFYDRLRDFESAAHAATSSMQLRQIKKDLILFHEKSSSFKIQGEAVKRVMILINTRLIYEFK